MLADAMHCIEKLDEGVRHGNGPRELRVVRAGKDYRPAGAINLRRREIHGLGEIAAGVMQQAAKSLGLVLLLPVRSIDKGRALLFTEKQALAVNVEKMCSHFL